MGGDFGSALLQPSRTLCVYGGTAAGAQCLRLSGRFFIFFNVICVFCRLVVLVRLSVPVQVIVWKDSSPK